MDSRKYQLFKTEMCRNWQEMGVCRQVVARPVQRVEPNPNALICYVDMQKSVGSRTASMSFGTCLYGVRCTFIHDEQPHHLDTSSSNASISSSSSPSSSASSSPLFTAVAYNSLPYYPHHDLNTWKGVKASNSSATLCIDINDNKSLKGEHHAQYTSH
ncbi:CCCH-type zinc finger transcription factor [Mucor lusitanicus CBS 277.49]|uniref:CCCH-type zinc finger transcription factor n=1 Tax=Mucor lusitanicus CBS 277.49 TaxID=747725 RepID=A0A162MSX1_MUCCL|nr:CCCH-type zinc finger transcription factor [Mucor lusitanicus CBS 277.49]